MQEKEETVVVLGASANAERYSNKAVKLLKEHGHRIIPVNPALDEIEGLVVSPDLTTIRERVDTLSIYLNPAQSIKIVEKIKQLGPKRVILNPGTESEALERTLTMAGIKVVKGCTLVLLRTGQF